ncbi:MAG: serine hydrolase domain-containing protein [Marinicella sp.]|nr:serine hydrolase [Xanthomonadales bacterium]
MKILSGLMLFWVMSVTAQIPVDVQQEVDLRIKHKHNPSIALAVFQGGHQSFYVKGWQNKEQQIPATVNTVYEIGSITKTFTGLLLAKLTEEGKVSLHDPVEQHWQQPFKLRDAAGEVITLKQLSTHTSGLPRLPDNLPLFADDPYATYDRDDLLKALSNIKPAIAGKNYAYSNLAVGLLGETLANAGGASYNELISKNIIQPLSLHSTYWSLQQVPEANLAQGYSVNKPTPAWNFKALAGAGALRSSITDLLAYGVAYLEQSDSLKKAMNIATTAHYQQDKLRVGLGWHINDDIIWHNGGTGGFRSILMINPKTQKVVAAITNHSQNDVEDLAIHLMDTAQPMHQLDFPVEIESTKLKEFESEYQQVENDSQITIKVIDDQLFFTAPKQPKQTMYYIGNDTFKFKMINVKIKFDRDDNGNIQALQLQGWGEPQTYLKKD